MTTAIEMTPAEFLECDLDHHPGFGSCSDPRLDVRPRANPPALMLPMPNLVWLVRRLGGIDAIPEGWPDAETWVLKEGGRTILRLSRAGPRELAAEGWHPGCPALVVTLHLPEDWPDSPWSVGLVMGDDLFPTTDELRCLAARALDRHVGEILDAMRDGGRFYVDDELFAL
jgi:hypothetical protein